MIGRGGQMIGMSAIILMLLFFGITAGVCQENPNEAKKYDSWLAKRPLISKIEIEGNEYFSDAKIRSRLFSRENSFWQWFKSGSRNKVLRYTTNRDTLEVKYLYFREGFLNVRIAEWFEIDEKDSSAVVKIAIEEGSQYLIGEVILDANDSLPFYRDLSNTARRLQPGTPVDPVRISEIVFNLKTVFANNGYPYAVVQQHVDSTLGKTRTRVRFITVEKEPVRFGEVEIKDLKFYPEDVVRREIVFQRGEPYSRQKIIESQKRLYSTNLFNSVSLDISKKDKEEYLNGGKINLEPNFGFSAIERRPHFLTLKAGAGQDPQQDLIWDFSSAWGKRNFLKTRRLELSAQSRFIIFTQWRPLYYRYQVRYTEPWIFNIRLPLTLTAKFEPGVRSQLQDYRIQKWSVALSTRKEWSEQLYAIISSEYENVNIYGVDDKVAIAIKDSAGISVRRKVTGSLVRDTRRDKFVPRNGSYTTYYGQFVGGFLGGDESFVKFEFSWARYQPAISSAVYATQLKVGWVKEFGRSQVVPTDDRFYLGGANSIRGFSENSIGPRKFDTTITATPEGDVVTVDTINVGANAYAIFNQELRFPLYWKLWGSVFTDIGNGWESFGDVSPDDLLFAYGAGIQLLSPAGPIRLDYAHRLENGIYREDDRWHITILYAF